MTFPPIYYIIKLWQIMKLVKSRNLTKLGIKGIVIFHGYRAVNVVRNDGLCSVKANLFPLDAIVVQGENLDLAGNVKMDISICVYLKMIFSHLCAKTKEPESLGELLNIVL